MGVYLNAVFFLGFIVNFLLLFGINRLLCHPGGMLRCACGALLGALYGLVCLLPELSFLGNPLWRFASFLAMGAAAFGWSKSALHRCGIFFLLSVTLGELAVQTDKRQLFLLLVWAFLVWGICVLGSGRGSTKREFQILKLTLENRSVSLLALVDTGNELVDPVTGRSVVVISPKAACRLTGLTEESLGTPLETFARLPLPGLRLIPYHSVGGHGMLLGMRIRDAELDGKKRSLLVAFATGGFGSGEVYQALTGGVL